MNKLDPDVLAAVLEAYDAEGMTRGRSQLRASPKLIRGSLMLSGWLSTSTAWRNREHAP